MIGKAIRTLKRLIPERHPLRLHWHRAKAIAAAARYGFPARKLRIIGVTGTDGKTTTVAMTAHILHKAGKRVGAVSTSFYRIGDKTEENPTHKTSLSPFQLQSFLKRCVRERCEFVVVEASSHGLVQHRLDFLSPAIAAITNTSPEHLDYHGTIEQYRKDKEILFHMLGRKGNAVLNADDETYEMYRKIPVQWRMLYSASRSFSKPEADNECALWAEQIVLHPTGSQAEIRCNSQRGEWTLRLNIPGRFNIENALCAVCAAHLAGVAVRQGVDALADFPGVPGRMERIDEGQEFSVFVDFTVTPKAYEETLAAARSTLAPDARLLVLTGSCGNRMREKRPTVGRIVSQHADIMVVTEDETITEDPKQTMDDVWSGVDQSKTDACIIPDRREAIRYLFQQAKAGDIVLLCGMGACQTMQTLQGLRKWDERQIARKLLKELHS